MKRRLDVLLVERGLAPSRERARSLVMAGLVSVDGHRVDKAGHQVGPEAVITVQEPGERYVSRGGLKLADALRHFGLSPAGMTALDVGASTGGFTDCLLQNGASGIYAVDVGYGQIDQRLRDDPRVTVVERTNIRYLERERVPENVDLATVDTSFISLKTVLPHVIRFVKPGGIVLALVKPQFELGAGEVGKGVVRDPAKHQRAVDEVAAAARGLGMEVAGVRQCPVSGAKGNVEFFLYLVNGGRHD